MLEDRTVPSPIHALFLDPSTPANGVFPTDWFTVADDTQNTRLRVNLPLPDQATHPSDFNDTQVLNALDGFNIQPRLSIPFDGPIDVGPESVNSQNIFLVSLGDTVPGGDKGGEVVGINQVVWDPYDPKTGEVNTLHVESDQLLDQHTRYALIVTDGVRDDEGHRVLASPKFRAAVANLSTSPDPAEQSYGRELVEALVAAGRAGVPVGNVVTASVFTTQSATAVLEKIRDQIDAATPAPANFLLGPPTEVDPDGTRTVFDLNQVTGISWRQQNGVDSQGNPVFNPKPVDLTPALSLLDIFPGAVGQLAFGKYSSPDFEKHPGEYIPAVGTRTTGTDIPMPAVRGSNDIYFNLYLPSDSPDHPKPPGGWPVAIYGHGINGSKDGMPPSSTPLNFASSMAAHGVATLAINAVGHGFGPASTLTVTTAADASVTFKAGGRGIDQNGDGTITPSEGFSAAGPQGIVLFSDGYRQTAADLMQLTRVIDVGMDVDGDGRPDLDASRIYYLGTSLGGGYGTVFTAVEPSVTAAVLNVPFDPIPSVRLAAAEGASNRGAVGGLLSSRQPSLRNPPGTPVITSLDGLTVRAPYFNENMPLRAGADLPVTVRLADGTTQNQVIRSPVTNDVAGAMAIQGLIENYEWVGQAGSPAAYAPHLRKESVIIQIAKGDQSAPNPTTTAIVRAGGLTDRTVYYRYDLAVAENKQNPGNPPMLLNPHTFLSLITDPNPIVQAVARGAQEQIATFFASGDTKVPPLGEDIARFFEVPIHESLPEGLNFVGVAPQFAPVGAAVTASGGSNDVPILLNGGAWDGGGSIEVRATDLPGDLLGLAFAATTIPDASAVGRFSAAPSGDRAVTAPAGQGQQSPVVSDAHGGVMDDALAAGTRPAPSPGSDLFDAAVLDQVFADSAGSPAAPFLDGPGL